MKKVFRVSLAFILINTFIMVVACAQTVGIGSTSFVPASTLAVDGGVTIGNSYRTTAVTDGKLIVKNNIGIGSSSPAATLDVAGTLAISGNTGTSGQVLQSNGASAPAWTTLSAGNGGGYTSMSAYCTAGTYTLALPATATKVMIEVWGAGGGGGGSNSAFGGSGGAGGGYGRQVFTTLAGLTLQIQVGTGGTAGNTSGGDGGAGGTSCVSSGASCTGTVYISATGGGAGRYGYGSGTGIPANAPGTSAASFNMSGQQGYDVAQGPMASTYTGGLGGGSGPDGCASGGTGGNVRTGASGTCGGGGGGGGYDAAGGVHGGGVGGAGSVIIWY